MLVILGCVSVIYVVLLYGFGLDSTRTIEIGALAKAVAIFGYAPLVFIVHARSLFRDLDSPNSDGARLRLEHPKHWSFVGAGKAVFAIAVTIGLGLQICAMVAPRSAASGARSFW